MAKDERHAGRAAAAERAGTGAARHGLVVRVRGLVQGVGFRPMVWREATALGLTGEVLNDGEGVLIRVWGEREALDCLVQRLREAAPPLSRVDRIEISASDPTVAPIVRGFSIGSSIASAPVTAVVPDAATCPRCHEDVADPAGRRFRYPFTNCTACGPRFSIVTAIPYDRPHTTMAGFVMCEACQREYDDPADRRFHAQPNACAACGPRVTLRSIDGRSIASDDPIAHAAALLREGAIVAIKGLGGFHLACDASDADAVARLRRDKGRPKKALAMMVRDVAVLGRYVTPSAPELALLQSAAAPIVLFDRRGAPSATHPICDEVAPAVSTWGFMLPYTPLHVLLLERFERPLVMTSANPSEAPQLVDEAAVHARLRGVADHVLSHDRPIANRVDDSVVRVVAGAPVMVRRARGYSPSPLSLPPGFEETPAVLAYGAELKATFCQLDRRGALLSQHLGDLEDSDTYAEYRAQLARQATLFRHRPEVLAADMHPDYLSTKLARERAAADALPLERVQHHHAHLAACLFEHGVPRDHPPVIALLLDGLGLGDDGALWGGEVLVGGYREVTRRGRLKPIALLGGAQAMKEPWRNTFAHLVQAIGWPHLSAEHAELALVRELATRPVDTLLAMLQRPALAPLASSAGRLFDAVAAALGLCHERQSHEGEAAMALEAACAEAIDTPDDAPAYPLSIERDATNELLQLEPAPMWRALLADLAAGTATPRMAARFHRGLARALVQLADALAWHDGARIGTVVLSGGVFQNATLLRLVGEGLRERGLSVLSHRAVPPNDGGIALGQAAVAAARALSHRGGA